MGRVLAILGAAFVLLLSERLRMDVVALLVLGGLALSGLVDTNQALSGFSSPAVVTVWSVFILGGGLGRTGAVGPLLGGPPTLTGPPPNLLVSDVLRDFSLRPFGMFDFTPVGGAVLLGGVAFMALIGRHLLPERELTREAGPPTD